MSELEEMFRVLYNISRHTDAEMFNSIFDNYSDRDYWYDWSVTHNWDLIRFYMTLEQDEQTMLLEYIMNKF